MGVAEARPARKEKAGGELDQVGVSSKFVLVLEATQREARSMRREARECLKVRLTRRRRSQLAEAAPATGEG